MIDTSEFTGTSMLAAIKLMDQIDNIDPDEPPKLIKYNPEKHDKLIPAVEPKATEEQTDDHQSNGIRGNSPHGKGPFSACVFWFTRH